MSIFLIGMVVQQPRQYDQLAVFNHVQEDASIQFDDERRRQSILAHFYALEDK